MSHLIYLATIFLFCGPPLLYMWKREGRILRKHEAVLVIVMILAVPFTSAEWFALHWRAWEYYSGHTLHVQVKGGAELETYLFAIGIFAAVASATLISITQTDRANARAARLKRAAKPRARSRKPKLVSVQARAPRRKAA